MSRQVFEEALQALQLDNARRLSELQIQRAEHEVELARWQMETAKWICRAAEKAFDPSKPRVRHD